MLNRFNGIVLVFLLVFPSLLVLALSARCVPPNFAPHPMTPEPALTPYAGVEDHSITHGARRWRGDVDVGHGRERGRVSINGGDQACEAWVWMPTGQVRC